jgi:UPF0271 protein
MRVVLDTSAIIYLQDFRKFDKIFIPTLVAEEVKDRLSVMKLESLNAKKIEPNKKFLDEVEAIAKKTGDLEKLSKTDIQVLALAKELKATIISDDYNIQNVAKKLKIEFLPVFSKGIKEIFFWKKYCPNCKKYFKSELEECPICGAKLKRVPKTK